MLSIHIPTLTRLHLSNIHMSTTHHKVYYLKVLTTTSGHVRSFEERACWSLWKPLDSLVDCLLVIVALVGLGVCRSFQVVYSARVARMLRV